MSLLEDPLVSAPPRAAIFMSRRSDLRLVKTPKIPRIAATGMKIGEEPGETLVFRAGRLDVPHEGTVELEDGRECDAQEVRAFLTSHRWFGDTQDGFWEVEQVGPPVSKQEMDAVVNAALEFDEAKLEAIVAQESAGWGRQDLIASASEALERMRAAKARQAELQAEQAKAKPKPAAKQAPQG
jgi:hypothetical protein